MAYNLREILKISMIILGMIALCLTFFMIGAEKGREIGYGLAFITCEYSVHLTEIVNNQSATLELYTGTPYEKLDYLNCSLLRH